MRRSWLAWSVGIVVVAGCLSGDPAEPGPDGENGPDASDVPPGCDAARSAVAHGPDGTQAAAPAAGPIMPCFHRLGVASFEPSIGVTSDGAVFVHPAAPLGLPSTVRTARSSDEGATWDILTPNLAGVPTHPYSQDPYIYVDPTTDRIFVEDLLLVPPPCGMLSISDDGGASWTNTQSGCAEFDHVSIFAGPAVTSPTVGYPNVVYRCAINAVLVAGASTMVTCQRSLDGGLTWLPPGTSPWVFLPGALDGVVPGACYGGNGHGAVGPDGTVYLPRGHCGQPELAISTDEALTWTTAQVSDLGNACDANFCEHDAGFGVDAEGTLYYSWVTGDRWLALSHSTDGGATWSTPVNVTMPGMNEAALVQMAVGGVGKVAFAYMATATGPGAPFAAGDYAETLWHAVMAVSHDALSEAPTFYSAIVNDPADAQIRGVCGPLRCDANFDFIDVRIAPDGTPWAPFVDGCFDACNDGDGPDGSELTTGRLWGGASLWDDADPNGPYPGP